MQRARRVAFVAVLALMGGLALAGCRAQPGAAIYLGTAKYTEKYVDKLSDQITLLGYDRGNGRQTVAQWLVVRDLGRRIVADKHFPAPQIDLAGAVDQVKQSVQQKAQQDAQTQVEADAKKQHVKLSDEQLQQRVDAQTQKNVDDLVNQTRPVVQLFAEYSGYDAVIEQRATAVPPTGSDFADLYNRAKSAGLVDPSQSEEAFASGLNQQVQQLFATKLGARKLYLDTAKRAHLSVNPKYGPVSFPVWRDQQGHELAVADFDHNGGGSPAVVPAPAQTTQAPAAG